jgi:hypothetical protein
MKLKQITAEEFALETGKFLDHALHSPLVVRPENGPALVIRPIRDDDDLADQLVIKNPRFRASVRRARRNRASGKGIPLRKLQTLL